MRRGIAYQNVLSVTIYCLVVSQSPILIRQFFTMDFTISENSKVCLKENSRRSNLKT